MQESLSDTGIASVDSYLVQILRSTFLSSVTGVALL